MFTKQDMEDFQNEILRQLIKEVEKKTMPMIDVTVRIQVSFREKQFREAIVETAREGAKQVLTNIGMLSASNSKIPPKISMVVRELGEEDRVYDIAKETQLEYAEVEDPFA